LKNKGKEKARNLPDEEFEEKSRWRRGRSDGTVSR